MKTVDLLPGVSMIEVSRRFRAMRDQGTRIIRVSHSIRVVPKKKEEPATPGIPTKTKNKEIEYWKVQYIGPAPDLTKLV